MNLRIVWLGEEVKRRGQGSGVAKFFSTENALNSIYLEFPFDLNSRCICLLQISWDSLCVRSGGK